MIDRPTARLILIVCALSPAPAAAQLSRWDRPSPYYWTADRWAAPTRTAPKDTDGRITTARFMAAATRAKLRHGAIALAIPSASETPTSPKAPTSAVQAGAQAAGQATFEAAVIDQLAKAGYETATPDPKGGQVADVRVERNTIRPEEARRNPVSGETMIGVSNRGSMLGMALNVDLSKPKKALVSTQLSVRIRQRDSQAVLWEGRATIETREGDSRWTQETIATRLAEALFDRFAAPGSAQIVGDEGASDTP